LSLVFNGGPAAGRRSYFCLGTGDPTTNWLDPGAISTWPARFYRIRLVP
jgi:hypothetical protein